MQLDCRCQGQKCRYARGMQRRQSSGGNHAREALLAHWPRPAAPLIIAALASAQFQRSGTRTQSAASPVCKRRERVGHPIWQPWQPSCCLSSSPLPLLAAHPNDQDRSRSRCPGSVLSLAPAPTRPVQIRRFAWLKGSPRLASPRLIRTSGREGASSALLLCRQHPCSTADNLEVSRPVQRGQDREPGTRTRPPARD